VVSFTNYADDFFNKSEMITKAVDIIANRFFYSHDFFSDTILSKSFDISSLIEHL